MMKLIAVAQRGTTRDFVDLYFKGFFRLAFFPVVIPTKEESSAHKSTYLQTRF